MHIPVDRLFHPDVGSIEIEQRVRLRDELARRYPNGVLVEGRIARIRHGVHLEGTLRGVERETCSRCLELFDRPIDIEVAETFSEDVGPNEDAAATVSPLVDRTIDLTDLVSQLLEVDEPMAPVCSPGCRGICPTCGVNRNVATCACIRDEVDPRLAGLARLRDEAETEII
jgi:uncharacterized protein